MEFRMFLLVLLIITILWVFARPVLTWIGAKIAKNLELDKREEEDSNNGKL